MYNRKRIYLKAHSRALKTVNNEEDGIINGFKVSHTVSYIRYLVPTPTFNPIPSFLHETKEPKSAFSKCLIELVAHHQDFHESLILLQ